MGGRTLMPRYGEITRDFGDGTYRFRMPLKCLRELEEKRKAGAAEICIRMTNWRHMTDDVIETMRLALIGGGDVTPVEAKKLTEHYCEDRPQEEYWAIAVEVLKRAIFLPDEPEAQKKIETNGSQNLATGSTSASSGETLPS